MVAGDDQVAIKQIEDLTASGVVAARDELVVRCCHDSQKPRIGIPRRGHPCHDPALHHASTQPALHRCHPRQDAGRSGRAEKGRGDCGEKCLRAAALVQAG